MDKFIHTQVKNRGGLGRNRHSWWEIFDVKERVV